MDSPLSLIAVLACPAGMVLMMWLMTRMMGAGNDDGGEDHRASIDAAKSHSDPGNQAGAAKS